MLGEEDEENVIRPDFFMRQALQLARQACEEEEIPVGAIIVSGKKIIARAWNQTEKLTDVTAHAEMLALTAACNHLGGKYLKDCTLYVTLEPCPMCAAALGWAQISNIVIGAADSKRGYSLYSPPLLHPKTQVIQGVLKDECAALMTDFFTARRK